MSDIVKSLRQGVCEENMGCVPFREYCLCEYIERAADEIERLRKEVAVVTACYLEVCSQRDQLMKAFSPPKDTPRPVETGRFGTYPPMSASCPVCHIQGVNGLVCYNPNCPTRVTSS